MKIFKYEIPIESTFYLDLPAHCKILSFQVQNDKPYIWVLVDEKKTLRATFFSLIGTGNEFEYHPDVMKFIGTIQLGSFVWHLFEDFL